ncbi:uncharacterized protein LOC106151281 [Lingula anatina]|uniref:Uncharacterized protein LOC106151281 n=1 Tax=Lingula anatina TaxID=7574 RepID=A0A1S3H353_LINAN|nr:uncharacterized protein LOC106151281 [Lingula anatina]|eukprot:XP_013379911.1 uncharacterized protein LOC106151281 [Lingula anatina]
MEHNLLQAFTTRKHTVLTSSKIDPTGATSTGSLKVKDNISTQGSQEKLGKSGEEEKNLKSNKKLEMRAKDTGSFNIKMNPLNKDSLDKPDENGREEKSTESSKKMQTKKSETGEGHDNSSFEAHQETQGAKGHHGNQTTTAKIQQTTAFISKQDNKRQANQTQIGRSGSNVMLDVRRRDCSKTKCQYVIWQCHHQCMGWGDRLRGIISVYAFAILTGREYRISHTFPCNLKEFFHGNKTLWDEKVITAEHATKRNIKLFGFLPTFGSWVLQSSNLSETFPEDIITFRTNNDIIPYLRFNKNFTKTIEKAFSMPIDDFHYVTLFRRLFHELFSPNKQFEEKFQKYYQLLKPSNDSTLVCAQIRLQFIKVSGMKNVFKFLQETIKRVGKSKLLVSTDAENVRSAAKTLFPEQLVDIEGPLGHVDKPGSGCRDMEKALTDFLMLSKCDILIHSPSGFGQQAAMLKYPYKDVYQINYAGVITNLTIPIFKLENLYEELGPLGGEQPPSLPSRYIKNPQKYFT